MAQGSLNTLLSNDLFRLGLIAVVAVIIVFALARRQPDAWPGSAEAEADPESQSPKSSVWTPPAQPAPPPPAAGPSLAVSVMSMRNEAGGLQVSWQAINGGSEPLAVQWGPPVVQVSGEFLELRYCYDALEDAGLFQAPGARTCGPGEVLSRSVMLSRTAIGRDPSGLSVTVVLGFGPAADHVVAQTGQDAYVSWQHTARSRPRPVAAVQREGS